MFGIIITGFVIVISILIEYYFSLIQILLSRPFPPKGAVEIDATEHIFAHPDHTNKLQDYRSFGAETVYEAILHGLKIAGDRPLFSFRQSSDQPFESYSHK